MDARVRKPTLVANGSEYFFFKSLAEKITVLTTSISDSEGCYNGIDPPLTWKSNGQLLATGVQAPNGNHLVGFIERNGLRHGEFKLPPMESNDTLFNSNNADDKNPSKPSMAFRMTHIAFNVDSTVLAVVCRLLEKYLRTPIIFMLATKNISLITYLFQGRV